MKREFVYKDLRLNDPDPTMAPNAVRDFYSGTYPDLVNAKVIGPEIKNDTAEFQFQNTIGTKG